MWPWKTLEAEALQDCIHSGLRSIFLSLLPLSHTGLPIMVFMKINPWRHKDQREYVFLVLDVNRFKVFIEKIKKNKVFIEFCYSIASVLYFAYLASRHLSLVGSSLLDQGMELSPPVLKGRVLTTGLFFITVLRENVHSAAANQSSSTPNTIPCHGGAMQ